MSDLDAASIPSDGEELSDSDLDAPPPPTDQPAPPSVDGDDDGSRGSPPPPDAPPSPADQAGDPPAAPPAPLASSEPVQPQLPPPPPPAVPVLRGQFSHGPSGWALRGAWTMSETDTLSSKFEFLKRAGEEADPSSPDGMPPSGLYDGFFMMKRLGAPDAKIVEHGVKLVLRRLFDGEVVDIPGTCTALQEGDLYMHGVGSNEFGAFELRGRFVPATNEVIVSKVYMSFNVVPLPGPKKLQRATSGSAKRHPRPAGAQTPGAPKTPKPRPPPKAASASPPAQNQAALDAAAAAAAAHAREQRKRNIPSHLRDAYAHGSHPGPFATCARILEQLMSHQFAYPFLVPVDPVALGIPDYPKVIQRPMDLGTIKHKLDNGAYLGHDEFAEDVRTTFVNAMRYNAPSTDIYGMADRLKRKFEEQWKLFSRQMATEAAELKSGSGGGASSAFLLDDDEEDEDYGAPPPAKPRKPVASTPGKPTRQTSDSKAPKPGSSGKKRTRPPAEPTAAPKRVAPAPPPPVYHVPEPGIGMTEVAELKSELQALRMQLRLMAQMTANVQMQTQTIKVGELTYEEKRDLSMKINQLDSDKLAKVVQIIAERMPLGSHSASEDIEIDIDALDVDTLRRLQDFVKSSLPKPKRAAAPVKTKSDLLKAVAEDSEANKQRILAMEKVSSGLGAGGPSIRPVGGYGSDMSDSDSDGDPPPPPPPPGTRF